jgi:PIN domain nuclease of toxin-antitoxin system
MRLLLDTHVAIWAVAYSEKLPGNIRTLIADAQNEVFVSAISVWEIAIKRALGKASAPALPAADAVSLFRASGFRSLDVTVAHALAVEELPLLHKDPFDRLLVAQALSEPMRLLTHDADVAQYGPTVIYF